MDNYNYFYTHIIKYLEVGTCYLFYTKYAKADEENWSDKNN